MRLAYIGTFHLYTIAYVRQNPTTEPTGRILLTCLVHITPSAKVSAALKVHLCMEQVFALGGLAMARFNQGTGGTATRPF